MTLGSEQTDVRDQVSDALRAYERAAREHGEHSEEAADAARDLMRTKLQLETAHRGGDAV